MLPLIGIGCPLKYGLVFGAGEKVSVPHTVSPLGYAGGTGCVDCAAKGDEDLVSGLAASV